MCHAYLVSEECVPRNGQGPTQSDWLVNVQMSEGLPRWIGESLRGREMLSLHNADDKGLFLDLSNRTVRMSSSTYRVPNFWVLL